MAPVSCQPTDKISYKEGSNTDQVVNAQDEAPPQAASADAAKDEFCRQFVEYMVKHGGETFDDGTSIRKYAEEVAPAYWGDLDLRHEGAEAAADADMSYWGEE